jgi:hypothetical protein
LENILIGYLAVSNEEQLLDAGSKTMRSVVPKMGPWFACFDMAMDSAVTGILPKN